MKLVNAEYAIIEVDILIQTKKRVKCDEISSNVSMARAKCTSMLFTCDRKSVFHFSGYGQSYGKQQDCDISILDISPILHFCFIFVRW